MNFLEVAITKNNDVMPDELPKEDSSFLPGPLWLIVLFYLALFTLHVLGFSRLASCLILY